MISGFEVQWEVRGQSDDLALEHFAVALERLGDGVTDFAQFIWPKVVPALEEEERKQFDAEGRGPARGSWAPLSPAYAERKAMEWPGKPTLERTGALREALTSSNAPGARRIITRDTFDFGTLGIEYASFHQVGTSDMPDRPPFDFGDELETAVLDAAKEGVREAMRATSADDYLSEGAA